MSVLFERFPPRGVTVIGYGAAMIVCYGRYSILDVGAAGAFAESSARFKTAGLAKTGSMGFFFADDLFESAVVHMIHRWDTDESVEAFRTSAEHDQRIAETEAFGEGGQVVRSDFVFFRGAEDGAEDGDEICCHLIYDTDPAGGEFVESCRRFQAVGLGAPGNRGFAFGRDQQDPRTVHLWHLWESKDAFDTFMASAAHEIRRGEVDRMEAAADLKRIERRVLQGVMTNRVRR